MAYTFARVRAVASAFKPTNTDLGWWTSTNHLAVFKVRLLRGFTEDDLAVGGTLWRRDFTRYFMWPPSVSLAVVDLRLSCDEAEEDGAANRERKKERHAIVKEFDAAPDACRLFRDDFGVVVRLVGE